uniref:3b protein n=1 Tax=Infectious bronchitis virus TaxID=11120 RepID=A0A023PN62_9GAMC|nr:3b protein [Infectious bronchitis virus]
MLNLEAIIESGDPVIPKIQFNLQHISGV